MVPQIMLTVMCDWRSSVGKIPRSGGVDLWRLADQWLQVFGESDGDQHCEDGI
jgi:hypothetical protein